jgi:hypothetical protein
MSDRTSRSRLERAERIARLLAMIIGELVKAIDALRHIR